MKWTTETAADFYKINEWGKTHFFINNEGQVCLSKYGSETHDVNVYELVQSLEKKDIHLPVILRFNHIIQHNLDSIYAEFNQALKQLGYKNSYQGVYPLKVNHQRHVVEAIHKCGARYNHGFEVGTKAELNIALAYLEPGQPLIVNGYKDKNLIKLALEASRTGIECVLVIESLYELPLILEVSEEIKIEPVLGIRIKLATKPSGHWQQTGGINSVFGLDSIQIGEVLEHLKAAQKMHCLKMLHFHFGSQLPMLSDIGLAVTEAARFFVNLYKEGAALSLLDVGGGLAIDYTGQKSSDSMSKDYTLSSFAHCVLSTIQKVLDSESIPHPKIISEFGRATVADSSVLIFNILDVNQGETPQVSSDELPEDAPPALKDMFALCQTSLESSSYTQVYNQVLNYRNDIYDAFRDGNASLNHRILAEKLFWVIMSSLKDIQKNHQVSDAMERDVADIYYGNFSIFQSLPDVWAIDQIFPIMPIHRLNEKPTREAIISDLTCDCDGKIDKFVCDRTLRSTLKLHEFDKKEPYYLGVFLIGAYQETLGDLHNLLGDTNIVTIDISNHSNPDDLGLVHGDTVKDVLSYCRYNSVVLSKKFEERLSSAELKQSINNLESKILLHLYNENLSDYTYNKG